MTGHQYLTALVVEPELADTLFVVSALAASGYRVTAADFQEAKARLAFNPPHLLVIDVRQGHFNGLHLVIRGRSARPRMAALVTSRYPDIVLQRDTEALGATFVLLPVTPPSLVAAAERTIWRQGVEAIRPPFERRSQPRRIAAVPHEGPERRTVDRRRAVLIGDAPSPATPAPTA